MNILYIMGRGHNGSTVLDLILGNHHEIQSVGELSSGLRRGVEEICTCGKNLAECEFWTPIRSELDEQYPKVKSDGYAIMLSYVDNFYRMPQLITRWFLPRWVKEQYQPMTNDLFEAIAENGQSQIVVDSSKEFSRAAYLLSRFPDKAKAIYLVRDGRAILWSYLKRYRKEGTFNFMRKKRKVNRFWPVMLILIASFVVSEIFALILKLLYGKRILTVRYEDICKTPMKELIRIGDFAGVDLRELGAKVEAKEPLQIGHNIGGNAMRRSNTSNFVFKPDLVWKEKLPRFYCRLYLLLGFIHAWPHNYK